MRSVVRFPLLALALGAALTAQTVYRSQSGGATPRVRSSRPAYADVAGTFHGKLKDISDKEIMIETDGHHLVSMRRSHKTKFLKGGQSIKATDIDLDTPVTVDASQEPNLKLTALRVFVGQPPQKSMGKR